MLTNALRALINNSLKKALIGKEKEKKKSNLCFNSFFIFHKINIKTFLK